MICPRCKKDDPQNREMCPACGAPIKPIPVPPGGRLQFGGYDWFVLDKQDGKTLIITEKVIEKRPYHHEEASVTWEICDMRKHLNGEFYNSFCEVDRARIAVVINENPDNPWYGTSGGNPTADKIFLLSISEVIKYFGDSGQINTREIHLNCDWCKDEYWPWFGDKYNINRRAVDDDGIVRHWTLRSPGANGHNVTFVMGFCGDEFDHGGINMVGSIEVMQNDKGTATQELRDALKWYGIKTATKARQRFSDKVVLQECCILSILLPGYGHWSLYYKGKYYDPEFGVSDKLPQQAKLCYYWDVVTS